MIPAKDYIWEALHRRGQHAWIGQTFEDVNWFLMSGRSNDSVCRGNTTITNSIFSIRPILRDIEDFLIECGSSKTNIKNALEKYREEKMARNEKTS